MPRHKQSDPTSIKTQVIRLRVTEAEAEQFKMKAKESGLPRLYQGENSMITTSGDCSSMSAALICAER